MEKLTQFPHLQRLGSAQQSRLKDTLGIQGIHHQVSGGD
jgi:hypothetical protein